MPITQVGPKVSSKMPVDLKNFSNEVAKKSGIAKDEAYSAVTNLFYSKLGSRYDITRNTNKAIYY